MQGMQDSPWPPPTQPVPIGPVPVVVPAGWYPVGAELRYWDGSRWTEHRSPLPATSASVVHHYHDRYAPPPMLVNDARTNGALVAVAWVLALLTFCYLLPWAVAATRGKSNAGAIGVLNLLLGWTFVGWVAALIMACSAHQVAAVRS